MELSQITRQRKNNRMSRLGILDEPMGYVEGANLYEFVADDPTGLLDPLGEKGEPATRPTSGPTTQPNLGWGDFQGKAPDNPEEDAFIDVELSTQYGKPKVESAKVPCGVGWNATAKYPDATVTATIDKKGSWVVKGQTTDSLLVHEVYHLIIAQIGAQRATQQFRTLTGNGTGETQAAAEAAAIDDLQKQIKAAFDVAQMQTQAQEMAYDDATDHSRNSEQQTIWQNKIQQWQAAGTWD